GAPFLRSVCVRHEVISHVGFALRARLSGGDSFPAHFILNTCWEFRASGLVAVRRSRSTPPWRRSCSARRMGGPNTSKGDEAVTSFANRSHTPTSEHLAPSVLT